MLEKKYRYNRNASGQTVNIVLGTHKYNKGMVSLVERNTFGVTLFAAITRYGKSTLVKNWYTQVAQYRGLIILDYLGEHTLSKFPNFLSSDQNTMCVPGLIEIKGFKFKISQFTNESDWHSLTFTDRGAMLMSDLARHVEAHRDDPERFWDLLDDVPVTGQFARISHFENEYGFHMPMYNSAVVDSCKALLINLIRTKFFGEQQDPTYDFGELALKHPYMNVNFNLGKNDIAKGRSMCGKVLEQLRKVLHLLSPPPLIVVEEADVLAPDDNGDALLIPSSTLQLVDYVIKLQKFNIEIAFIVQDPNRLNRAIVGNRHNFVFGQLPEGNPQTELSKQLVWDMDNNYREFILQQTGVPGYQVFIPQDSMTLY